MTDCLFLSQRIPYPPDKGDKIRSYRALRHVAEKGRVYLGCLIDDPADWTHVARMEALCEDVHAARLTPSVARIRSTMAFLRGSPLSQYYFFNAGLRHWVDQVLSQHRPDVAFVFSSAMAQYVAHHPHRPPRIIIDYVDVDSDKWRQYAASQKGLKRWVFEREARTLLDFDRKVGAEADVCTFVSQIEADLFASLAPELKDKVLSVPNGIDTEFFSPSNVSLAKKDMPEFGAGPNIVVTGHMDYWPNVDAALWFASLVMPILRTRYPSARFIIVGAQPSAKLTRLSVRDDIVVTGRVDDVRPYLLHSDAVVAPMRIARGIQNKVLEGMAMARPVITTAQGLEGIDAEPGRHLLLAETPEDFAGAIERVLSDKALGTLGPAARTHMTAQYQWAVKMSGFDTWL